MNFFTYFPADDYLRKFSQTKISNITNFIFDQFDSFSSIVFVKHLEDQLKKILKVIFTDKEERNVFCKVNLPNLEKYIFLPLNIISNNYTFYNNLLKLQRFH